MIREPIKGEILKDLKRQKREKETDAIWEKKKKKPT